MLFLPKKVDVFGYAYWDPWRIENIKRSRHPELDQYRTRWQGHGIYLHAEFEDEEYISSTMSYDKERSSKKDSLEQYSGLDQMELMPFD